MTNKELIKEHYSAIALAALSRWGSGSRARVRCIQRHLEVIKNLQEPEPKNLASSVLRLTSLCNRLEIERDLKSEDLEAASYLIKELEIEVTKQKRFAANLRSDRSKAKKQISALQVTVAELEAENKRLKRDLTQGSWDITMLKRDLALKDRQLAQARGRLKWVQQCLEVDQK